MLAVEYAMPLVRLWGVWGLALAMHVTDKELLSEATVRGYVDIHVSICLY
jgi:hypothetical protein